MSARRQRWEPALAAGCALKAQQLLQGVLEDPNYAERLEAAIRELHPPARSRLDHMRYTSLVRRMLFNLKNNPQLQHKYEPDTLCTRSPMDLAAGTPIHSVYTEYEQREMQKYAVNAADHVVDSLIYQCARCKSRKVTFYSLQTRSADEPMTNYFTCHNCSKVWKMC